MACTRVLRDRPDDSHGEGGLLQVGGPVADALWLQGFRVALLTLCLFVGGKQKKETKITISTRKKNEHSMPSSPRVHRTETHTVLCVQPHPFANLAQVPLIPAPRESFVSVGSSDVVGSGPNNVNIESRLHLAEELMCLDWRFVRGRFVLQWKVWWILVNSSSPSTLIIKSTGSGHWWCR